MDRWTGSRGEITRACALLVACSLPKELGQANRAVGDGGGDFLLTGSRLAVCVRIGRAAGAALFIKVSPRLQF
jgi:hypothetical protein